MGFQGSGFWVYGIEGLGLGAWGGGLGLKGFGLVRGFGAGLGPQGARPPIEMVISRAASKEDI